METLKAWRAGRASICGLARGQQKEREALDVLVSECGITGTDGTSNRRG
jgi:hypothetical protein